MRTDIRKGRILVEEKQKERKRTERTAETLLALCLFYAAMTAVRDLSYSTECGLIGGAVGTVAILLLQLTAGSRRASERLRGLCYAVGLVCFVLFFRYLVQGFLYSADVFLELWGSRFSVEVPRLSVSNAAAFGSFVLWALTGLSSSILILTQIQKKGLLVLVLLELPAFAFGSVLGISDLWLPVLLLLGAVTGTAAFYGTPRRKNGLFSVVCMAFSILLVGVLVAATTGYRKAAVLEQGKQGLKDALEAFRYGEDTLPQGDLKKAAGLLDGDLTKPRLKLQISKPQELYLRGYIGAEYTGQSWEELPLADYQGDYAGMLDWLKQKDFEPVRQFAQYEQLTDAGPGYETDYAAVSAENVGANRKYVYLPAAVSSFEAAGAKLQRDTYVHSTAFFGAGSYSFEMVDQAPTAEKAYPALWTEYGGDEEKTAYLDAESVYHSFTEEYYLALTDRQRELMQEVFFPGEDPADWDFGTVTTQIRQVLRTMRYQTNPADWNGSDYIRAFLKDGRGGNAVAYASAAVLAYRAAGYPARYAEGYHLSAEDAKAAEDSGEVTLTTKQAHAWAEVYVNRIGWLPVEVVPGMYVENYTNQKMEGRPAYKVHSGTQDAPAAGTEEGDASESKKTPGGFSLDVLKKGADQIIDILLLAVYTLLLLYLLLELQRCLRKRQAERRRQKRLQEDAASCYMDELERLFLIGGIRGDFSQPETLWPQIGQVFPGVRKEEQERTVELLEKAGFGGIALKPHELYTVDCFRRHLSQALYKSARRGRRLWLRYALLLDGE